jgi:DNA mismatch repair protein MLH3
MPVRVKQRAFAIASGGDDEKAWHELKHGIAALLLAWLKPCAVNVRDLNSESRKIHLSASHPSISHTLTEKSLKQLTGQRVKYDLKDMLPVLFQSNLAPAESRARWVPVSATSSTISIKGLICLDPAPTRACQFISLGIHPCITNDGYADVYDTINKVFSNSNFGAPGDDSVDIGDEEKERRKIDQKFKQEGFTRKQVQARKGVDRWPIFILLAKFMDRKTRSDGTNERSLKALTDILEAAVREWLVANHFRPKQKRQKKTRSGEQSPGSVGSSEISGRTTPVTTTPSAKRASGAGTSTISKKRKVLDLSGRLRIVDQELNGTARPTTADFSTWSRIKSGRHAFYDDIWDDKAPHTAPTGRMGSLPVSARPKMMPFELPTLEAGELSVRPKRVGSDNSTNSLRSTKVASGVDDTDHKLSSDDFGSVDSEVLLAVAGEAENQVEPDITSDALVEWTDPSTKRTYEVNARTGVVLPTRQKSHFTHECGTKSHETPVRTSAAINTSLTSAGLPLTLAKRPSTANKQSSSQWLPGFLKDWNNPVFARQDEEPIPVASHDGPGIDVEEAINKGCTHDATATHFNHRGEGATRKLSKYALQKAKVLRQVDRKFILCKVKEEANEVLVLVDQHAASERVILEGLFEELCAPVESSIALTTGSTVETVRLEKPQRFHVPATEFELFNHHSRHFADWGILYSLHQKDEVLSASQVRPAKQEYMIVVKALPPGIAERCTLFPKLLIELLRSEIWSLTPHTRKAEIPRKSNLDSRSTEPNEQASMHSWLNRIGSCPKGILDLLNSRACRSAIMFNDELSNEQCEELLRDLSKCAFPFMCAHGRVSMVPLAELGSVRSGDGSELSEAFESERERNVQFIRSFRRWRDPDSDGDIIENVSK